MRYKALIFDLFGTLVPSYSRRAYDQVLEKTAAVLHAPHPEFREAMKRLFYERAVGTSRSVEENLVEACRRLDRKADRSQIAQAAALRYRFTQKSLIPNAETLKALAQLKSRGRLLGMITNCASDTLKCFPQSPLATYIDAAAFSCEERIQKPARAIYETACRRLNVKPQECVYIGDGSGEELTGAAAVGMFPILKRVDLTDVYDPHRPDVENWRGVEINEIAELCEMTFENHHERARYESNRGGSAHTGAD